MQMPEWHNLLQIWPESPAFDTSRLQPLQNAHKILCGFQTKNTPQNPRRTVSIPDLHHTQPDVLMFLPRTALLLQKNLLPAVRCTICEVASKRMDTANIHLPDPSHFLLSRIPRHILFHISPKHKSYLSAFPPASQ